MILALSRAIGETAPLIVVGAATFVAFDPDLTSAVHGAADPDLRLGHPAAGRSSRQLAAGAILVLMVLLLAMNAVAIYLRNRYEQKW